MTAVYGRASEAKARNRRAALLAREIIERRLPQALGRSYVETLKIARRVIDTIDELEHGRPGSVAQWIGETQS